ncbi:MAG: hypothetical protein ABGX87_19015 [Alcanivorax sp.]
MKGEESGLLELVIRSDLSIHFYASFWIVFCFVAVLLVFILRRISQVSGRAPSNVEFDGAEFGLGAQRIKLKPNYVDKQIAYKVWVELSTRKIGIGIDLDNDVVVEVYNSWYSFFSVTRELIKDIPVSKIKRDETRKIVDLSIDVLNAGIRPHLTKWQARFRHWYERQMELEECRDLSPQEIQKRFPEFEELAADMKKVNKGLMKYRDMLNEIVQA